MQCRWLLLSSAIAFISGCGGMQLGGSASSPRAVAVDCPSAGDELYFPKGVLQEGHLDSDAFVRRWYTRHLHTMGEPSLSCGRANAERAYRFLWLRTNGRPIAVRVERSADVITLNAVELSGKGGYEPGAIAQRFTKSLAPADWEKLDAALTGAGFTQLPTVDNTRFGTDGAQWIVEGRRGNWYHVVERWSPDDGAYKDLGLLFLKLADFPVTGSGIY